ncbi:hypothetical protein XELAEV_18016027mg [Xenopus laevis]|uniref:Uncharacterized protein n=1 Tax=Xenopus laevis TaxID=8355 RepID=A0A974HWQ7_XENLA|nr:hypothetical protein XELAEV_18016027mg [Xenopus laevis]
MCSFYTHLVETSVSRKTRRLHRLSCVRVPCRVQEMTPTSLHICCRFQELFLWFYYGFMVLFSGYYCFTTWGLCGTDSWRKIGVSICTKDTALTVSLQKYNKNKRRKGELSHPTPDSGSCGQFS